MSWDSMLLVRRAMFFAVMLLYMFQGLRDALGMHPLHCRLRSS